MVITSTLKRFFILLTLAGSLSFTHQAQAQDAAEGEKLFSENCNSCHILDGKSIGPDLRGVNQRRKHEWLLKWVKNSPAMIASGDPTAVKLFEENNKAQMTVFENLSNNQIESILKYIETAPTPSTTTSTSTTTTTDGTTTGGTPPHVAAGGFYSTTTLIVLAVLVLVLIVIGVLLARVKTILNTMVAAKYPEDEELNKPSWYESKFRPWLKDLNPTIATLVVVLVVAVISGGFYFKFATTEIGVQQGYAPTQPINFPHDVHAGQYKIDCQFCHSTASYSKQASVPAVNTCMNCHKHVDAADKYGGKVSPEIQKVRDAYESNTPIKWVRIHNLPDLAYFNHSQHVSVGKLECQTCHGPVETMKKVEQVASLQMGWCVNCHREAQVDVANNDYYEELHKNLQGMGRKALTVAQNGGLECGKCHY